ncbi:hypothetical protein SNEBB_004473 [Seison nebaliae]|nr:hypothetical protein SNEBB_004473 [Seison nebaliae]
MLKCASDVLYEFDQMSIDLKEVNRQKKNSQETNHEFESFPIIWDLGLFYWKQIVLNVYYIHPNSYFHKLKKVKDVVTKEIFLEIVIKSCWKLIEIQRQNELPFIQHQITEYNSMNIFDSVTDLPQFYNEDMKSDDIIRKNVIDIMNNYPEIKSIRSIILMMTDLHIFRGLFLSKYIEEFAKFLRNEVKEMLKDENVPIHNYLIYVQYRIKLEVNRLHLLHMIDKTNVTPLIHHIDLILIWEPCGTLLKGCADLFISFNIPHMRLMYSLMRRMKNNLSMLEAANLIELQEEKEKEWNKNGIEPLKNVFHSFIISSGFNCMKCLIPTKSMGENQSVLTNGSLQFITRLVSKLLTIKSKFDFIAEDCFDSNEHLVATVQGAFDSFLKDDSFEMNVRQVYGICFAELLALYVDRIMKLKKGELPFTNGTKLYFTEKKWWICMKENNDFEVRKYSKNSNVYTIVDKTEMSWEMMIDLTLDDVLIIFRCLRNHDVFEQKYKNDLAKRLISQFNNRIDDHEKLMVEKLEKVCGSNSTGTISNMFKDIEMSSTNEKSFKKYLQTNNLSLNGNLLNVKILSVANWPKTYAKFLKVNETDDEMNGENNQKSVTSINLPGSLEILRVNYEQFYTSTYRGRHLNWQNHYYDMCHVEAFYSYNGTNKTYEITLYQAIILELFNHFDKLTCEEIMEKLNIDSWTELERSIITLCEGTTKVLLRSNNDCVVQQNEIIQYNPHVESKNRRIKLIQVEVKEDEVIDEQKPVYINTDRQFELDATIMRTMKKHRNLTTKELYSNVNDILNFPNLKVELKNRLEKLIEREYIYQEVKKKSETTTLQEEGEVEDVEMDEDLIVNVYVA